MLCRCGDIWKYLDDGPIGIPTNGYVTRNGTGVLGRGLAKQALERFPDLGYTFGQHLKTNGHCVGWMNSRLISIPVKPVRLTLESENDYDKVLPQYRSHFTIGQDVPGYGCKADINLIQESLLDLADFIRKHKLHQVFIPALGCGNGGLNFGNHLWPLLSKMFLDDKIILVVFSED